MQKTLLNRLNKDQIGTPVSSNALSRFFAAADKEIKISSVVISEPINTKEQARKEGHGLPKETNGVIAVIVLTAIDAKLSKYGIQYWTLEEIEKGSIKNTDRTISTFVERL